MKQTMRLRTQIAVAASSAVQAPSSHVSNYQQQQQADLSLQDEQHPPASSTGPAAIQQQQQLQLAPRQQEHSIPLLSAASSTATLPLLLSFLWADSAAAATVCLDVPDWLVDWRALLFHSPVVAVGVAGLALVLFPKLIRVRPTHLNSVETDSVAQSRMLQIC
jgi:hypothetical protein